MSSSLSSLVRGRLLRSGLLRPRERRGYEAERRAPPSSFVALRRVMWGGVEEPTLI